MSEGEQSNVGQGKSDEAVSPIEMGSAVSPDSAVMIKDNEDSVEGLLNAAEAQGIDDKAVKGQGRASFNSGK